MKILFLVFLALSLQACSNQSFQTIKKEGSFSAKAFYNDQVDILWVIDNSYTTMIQHQNRIAQNMQEFYNGMLANKANFRVAATTMDTSSSGEQGSLVGSPQVISLDTPNPVQKMQEMIQRGGNGSSFENGLAAMASALQKQNNFLRPDALLVVVFITDDQDTSYGTVTDYKNFLDQLKGENTAEKQNWIANYIGVTSLNDPRCRTYQNYSAIGRKYIDLAEMSGGIVDTICYTDFSSYMNQISVRLKSVMNEFFLEKRPLLDSLSVYKNGVLVRQDESDGWVYNAERNSILLLGSAKPGPNDKIDIDFELGN